MEYIKKKKLGRVFKGSGEGKRRGREGGDDGRGEGGDDGRGQRK